MSKHNGKFWSRIQFKEDGEIVYPEDYDEETIQQVYPDEVRDSDIARVHLQFSRTIEMEGYNSAKVTVGVDLPCHVSEIDEGYEAANEIVGSRYVRYVESVEEQKERRQQEQDNATDDEPLY